VIEAQLASAVSERRLVLVAGSGLTRDADLPDWSGLVASLCQSLELSSAVSPEVATAARVLAATNLASSLQVLLSQAPRRTVSAHLRTLLAAKTESKVVAALAAWRLRGVIITNFDRETERLVPPTAYRISNSEATLKLVTAAIGGGIPFVWKLHGDIDDELEASDSKVAQGGPFMVLSNTDFAVLVQGDRGRQILGGVLSVLQTYPVAFVGYSLSDPDINVLLSWLNANCQFVHPSWFIGRVGDRVPLPANVQLIEAVSDWGDLVPWIESVTSLADRAVPPGEAATRTTSSVTTREAYLAIGKYLADLEAPGAAERVLAAALFDELAALKTFDLSFLASRVAAMVGVGPALATSLAQATVRLLVDYELVDRDGTTIQIRPEAGEKLQERGSASWGRERDEFFRSVSKRLPVGVPLLSDAIRYAIEATLLDLCAELGEAMAEWVSRGVGGDIGWPDFGDRLRPLLDDDEELRLTNSLLHQILLNPRDAEVPYLYRLLSATFLANTVRLNPVAAAQLREALSVYELYLDANVLLPLVVSEHPNHAVARAVVEESLRAGVRLAVLTPLLNEVHSHRDLARRDLRDLGGDARQLSAIAGALGSRTNAFVQGFLHYRPHGTIGAQADWREYMSQYTERAIEGRLAALGISIVVPEAEAGSGQLYVDALAAIRNEWLRKLGRPRDDILNIHEAIQICQIYLRRERSPERRDHIWFLSNERVLQHVFEREPAKWLLPATFPYSAWVAFLDSRMPHGAQDPGAIVKAILRGRAEAFELPTPIDLIRQRAFGDRVTSREEEEALGFAASDFALMKRVEEAQRAVFRRADAGMTARRLSAARQEAVAEVSGALDAEIARLRGELTRARTRIGELEAERSPRPGVEDRKARRRRKA
jgi:hypothetical protein